MLEEQTRISPSRLLAIGYWLLAIGYWLLAIGFWLLAIAYWLFPALRTKGPPISGEPLILVPCNLFLIPGNLGPLFPAFYTLNEEPQPHVDFTCGFSNLKPAASRVST